MKNITLLIALVILTLVNLVLVSCGTPNQAVASNSYRHEFLFNHWCITNDVSIWCEQ